MQSCDRDTASLDKPKIFYRRGNRSERLNDRDPVSARSWDSPSGQNGRQVSERQFTGQFLSIKLYGNTAETTHSRITQGCFSAPRAELNGHGSARRLPHKD